MISLKIIGICLLLVSAANDSYKLISVVPVGLPILFLIISLSIIYVAVGFQIKVRNICIIAFTIIYFTYGTIENKFYFVLQDALPLLTFILISTANLNLDNVRIVYCLRSYTRVCLLILTAKIFYVIYFRPEMAWGEQFLAVNYDFNSLIPRIIFKGVEPILMLALFLELTAISYNRSRNFFYVALAIVLIVLNGSRPLIVSSITYLFFCEYLMLARRFNTKMIGAALISLVILSAYFLSLNTNLFRSNDKYETIQVSGMALNNVSVSLSYRIQESYAAIASVDNWIIGDGLGKAFVADSSGATSEDGSSPFTHSLVVWVFIKFGVLGLALLLWFILTSAVCALKEYSTLEIQSDKLFITTHVFFLLFIFSSFITNQATSFTGGILLGVIALLITNFQTKKLNLKRDYSE